MNFLKYKELRSMDLTELRKKIDEIDDELIELFKRRMDIVADIACYKKENGLAIYDPERERQKLYDLTLKASDDNADYIIALYSLLFELSRSSQERILNLCSENALHDNTNSELKYNHVVKTAIL